MEEPWDLSGAPAIVGMDTNVILDLASNPNMLEGLQEWLDADEGIALVLPLQVFQESWNCVQSIAKRNKTPLGKLGEAKKLATDQYYPVDCIEALERIENQITAYEESLLDVDVAIENLQEVFRYFLDREKTILASFPRNGESEIYDIRFGSKTPPGFEDVKNKDGMHYGDLSVWLDFLTGLAYAQEQLGITAGETLFLTNDNKIDWVVKSGFPHPMLRLEALLLTGMPLKTMRYADFWKRVVDA